MRYFKDRNKKFQESKGNFIIKILIFKILFNIFYLFIFLFKSSEVFFSIIYQLDSMIELNSNIKQMEQVSISI